MVTQSVFGTMGRRRAGGDAELAVGRPAIMIDGTGATTRAVTGTVLYDYSSAGNRISLTYPDGKLAIYHYDLAARPVSVSD